ncbi:MAG: phage tail tube protein [Prochlorococcaceae cyanobacterium]
MPLLSRKRLILAKAESTYGTDPTPTGAANAILVRNLEITPLQAETVSRELIRPYLGVSDQLLAQTRVEVTFEVELAGSGTAGTAPAYGPVLKACGLSETVVATTSVTYAPVSASFSSVTIYFHNDGIRHKVTGCRGTFTLNAQVGQIPTIAFTMTGIYNAPTDESLPSPTYANQAAPLIFKNGNTSNFSVFSYSGCLQSLNFDVANNIVYRELVGCTKEVLITDRGPNGTCVIEAPSIATKDFFTIANGSTTGSITFQHGATAGNIVTFTTAQSDIGSPSYSDQDGIQMLNLPYLAIPTSAGNDELSLAYT